jgi:hypothetical protein
MFTMTQSLFTCSHSQDNVDSQYAGFRQNIPALFVIVLLHPLLRKAYDSFWRADTYTKVRPSSGNGLTMGLTASAAADARLNQRVSFDVIFAGIFLTALHGFSVFKILAILYANYCIATKLPKPYVPAASWVFAVGTLFANEFTTGYSYAAIFGMFLPASVSEKGQPATNFGHTLDSYGGLMSRWEVLFKFTILRLVSFNLDYYWSLNSRAGSPLEVCHPSFLSAVKLITSRRNNSIPQTYPSAIESPFPQEQVTFPFAITLHTPCTRRSTSPGQS